MKDLNENEFFDNSKFLNYISPETITEYCKVEEYNRLVSYLSIYTQRTKEEISITNGGYHALRIVMNNLIGYDENMIVLCPNYPIYLDIKRNIKKVFYHLYGEEEIKLDTNELLNSIDKETKLIYLSNPNNPLGIIHTKEEIQTLLDQIPSHIYLLIDEAYIEFSSEFSSTDLLNDYNNLIIVRTFSKAFGQAGAKLGYIIANKNLIYSFDEERGKILSLNAVSINLASQKLEELEIMHDSVKKTNQKKINFYKQYETDNYIKGYGNFLCVKNTIINKNIENYTKDLNNYPDIGEFGSYCRLTIGNR